MDMDIQKFIGYGSGVEESIRSPLFPTSLFLCT